MSARFIPYAAVACLVGACAEDPARDVAALTTSNSVHEDETQTPPPDPTSGGGAKIAEGPIAALLAETASMRPPPELFEFVGYVGVLTPAQHAERMRARDARRAQMTVAQYEAIAANESAKDERDAARMVIVSADGRMFRERVGAFPNRPRGRTATALPTRVRANETVHDDDMPSSAPESAEVTWGGSDGRALATSSAHPWRSFASLRVPDTDASNCSAGMIMPRVAITSAHCVSPDGNSLSPHQLAPGARGPSFSTDFDTQYPFGRRFIQWYVWPNGWHGQDAAKYDYAVVIMRDINWSPGYIYVGKRSNIAYTHHWNQQYPGNNNSCADAPASAAGKCGGFRYTQYENVRTAGDGYFFHEWDTNGGSSGSPMYYSNGDDYRMIFGHNEGSVGIYNTATRIMNWTMDDFICPIVEGDFQYEIDGVDHTARSKYFDDPECN